MKIWTVSVYRPERRGVPAILWWNLGLVSGGVLGAALTLWDAGEMPLSGLLLLAGVFAAVSAVFVAVDWLERRARE